MTSSIRFDVTAIGNALVDVIAQADDDQLARHNLRKGGMSLVDTATAERLYATMAPAVERSGGSVANTVAGIAALGGRAAYIGKVADDQLGDVFAHDIRAVGVTFATPRLVDALPTGRSLIFVTPDAQRTMQTCLGAAALLGPEDIDMDVIMASRVVYLEGYLWDQPRAKEAMRDAALRAQQSGVKVALTLSDASCVARFRDEFRDLVERHVDILFANESEILALYQAQSFDEALQHVRGHTEIAALTRSEKGSVIINRDEVHIVDAMQGVRVVDTTGAGDAYAAGFLYAYTQGCDLGACGRLGSAMAAEVIGHYGPRPESDVKKLATAAIE